MKKENLILENYDNEFSYEENKSNLKITFNRIAFIFFVFLIISFIYSIKVFYLSSAEKLLKFQDLYFEDELIKKDIQNIKVINEIKKNLIIQQFKFVNE